MITRLLIQSISMVCFWACSLAQETEPYGPIARFGSKPTIDGMFEKGEWDDAEVVQTGKNQQFRLKHDNVNLYLALDAGGGNLWFNKNDGMQVLHWSSQLGSAKYKKTDSLMQVLNKPLNGRLWRLQDESPDVIKKTLIAYLEEEGWTANIAPLGPKMQSEFAISFEWLGVKPGSEQYVRIPDLHIGGGLMLTRSDPEFEKIMAMTLDDRKNQYPSLFWPESPETHPLNGGPCPEMIKIDPVDFGTIWIDLGDNKGGRVNETSSQEQDDYHLYNDTTSFNTPVKNIIVPKCKEDVEINGQFEKGEWEDAYNISVADNYNIYIKADKDALYIGLKSSKPIGEFVNEIRITANDSIVFLLHSSGALGEGVSGFPSTTEFNLHNNKYWVANSLMPDSLKKEAWIAAGRPIEDYDDIYNKRDGAEYRISKQKFGSDKLKLTIGWVRVEIKDGKPDVRSYNYPENISWQNSKGWLELILPQWK